MAAASFDVVDPATEEVVATVADATAADAVAAVDRAADAFPGWAGTPPRERAEVLRRAYELLVARTDEVATTIVRENGKPLAEAKGEVAYAAEFFRWYSEEAVRVDGSVVDAPAGGGKLLTLRQPVGVSLLITPWNFPAAMLTRKIGPALAAGCTVVAKPAELTPLTALLLGDLLRDAGAPDGCVEIVTTTDAATVVDAVLRDRRVRKLSFTGSTEVGRILLGQAAERVLNCSMELGGNAPFLVYADAVDLPGGIDAVVEGALVAKLRHNGETCTAANRFYVEAPVVELFTERLAAAMAALPVGPGIDPTTKLGPLIDAATREKVERLVQAGVDDGAAVVTGGGRPADRPKGYFYEPTVLGGVRHGSPAVREEIFGPVAPVIRFDAADDVVAMASDADVGLVAYVYTADLRRALDVAERLETGMVGVNKGTVSDPAAPFGGVKQSGLGREGGHEGLLAFCETKYVAVDW
jgi:succinate-semialdehyde dehydrogenase / glutarate-semialdehyde dehydrogenase